MFRPEIAFICDNYIINSTFYLHIVFPMNEICNVPVRKALAKKSGYMKFHSVYSPFTSRLRYILTWKRLKFIIERRCVQIHVADYDEFKQCMRPSPLVGLDKLDRRRRKRKQAFLLIKISLRSFSKLVHDLKNLQLRCLHQTKAFHFAEYQSVRRLISRILSYLIHKKAKYRYETQVSLNERWAAISHFRFFCAAQFKNVIKIQNRCRVGNENTFFSYTAFVSHSFLKKTFERAYTSAHTTY